MKYKTGDKVKIKSLDWYNQNKDEDGFVHCGDKVFDDYMSVFCESIVTIGGIYPHIGYDIREDMQCRIWTEDMIEGLADEEPQDKMVSLEKVVKYLQSKLEYSPDIDGLQIYDTSIEGFVNDLRKIMEE